VIRVKRSPKTVKHKDSAKCQKYRNYDIAESAETFTSIFPLLKQVSIRTSCGLVVKATDCQPGIQFPQKNQDEPLMKSKVDNLYSGS